MAGPSGAARRLRLLVAAIALVAVLLPAQAVQPIIGPSWNELPAQKKEILAPLAGEWDQFDTVRRKKWLDIAERYPRLSQEEQARIQTRMKAWAKLTPLQRHAARTKYRNVQNASPEQRDALKKMWAEYEALPEDQKQRFKQSAGSRVQDRPDKPRQTKSRPVPAIPARATRPAPSSSVQTATLPTAESAQPAAARP